MVEKIGVEASPNSARWVVSEFTIVSWRAGRVEIMSATSGAMFVTNNVNILHLLHAFAEPQTLAEVVRDFGASRSEQTAASIDKLISGQVLIPASEPETATAHYWDWSALAFHRHSRQPGFHKTLGQTTAAVAPRRSPEALPLMRGSNGETANDLANLLDKRRSCRSWPAIAVSRETFSRFLWLSARNRDLWDEGTQNEYVSRPYPSGGAAYSLEIYPVIAPQAVESISAGLYRYLPMCHALEPVSMHSRDYLPFLEAAAQSAGSAAPPIVLVITSRFARQSENHGNLAYSLVLKEVGCLFQTLYLVGEYLGLGVCALGGGAPGDELARVCQTSELAEPVVGEFMLGPR